MEKEIKTKNLIKKSFYFMRHGQTDWNQQGLCMGHQDIPLNETGRAQALAAQLHKARPIECVYYSPLKRAEETMNIIASQLSCPKISHDSLKEWHFGEWEGKIWGNLNIEHIDDIMPPNGESREEFFLRVLNCTNNLLAQHEQPILIIAHAGIFWALCHFAGHENINIKNCQLIYFDALKISPNWAIEHI